MADLSKTDPQFIVCVCICGQIQFCELDSLSIYSIQRETELVGNLLSFETRLSTFLELSLRFFQLIDILLPQKSVNRQDMKTLFRKSSLSIQNRTSMTLCLVACISVCVATLLLRSRTTQFSTISSSTKVLGSTIIHTVPPPVEGKCTIFRCANHTMENVQVFSHPSFFYIFLDESEDVRIADIWPSWCRVPHLISLHKLGHTCVVYADDDVFLNLSRLHNVIDAVPKDLILVGSNNRHGRFYNINAGLLIFTNIQGPFTYNILTKWRKSMEDQYYHDMKVEKLREQGALNDMMNCNMSNVLCYHLFDKKELGIINHCFSCLNTHNPTGKKDCMVRAKAAVKQWDSA